MNSDAKRMLLFTTLCLLILFGWLRLNRALMPPPASAPADSKTLVAGEPASEVATTQASMAAAAYDVVAGPEDQTAVLGVNRPRSAGNPFLVALELDPRGAAVSRAFLTEHRDTEAAGAAAATEDTYDLLSPVRDPRTGRLLRPLATRSVRLLGGAASHELGVEDVPWAGRTLRDGDIEEARFETSVLHAGAPVLALTKRWRLAPESHRVELLLSAENRSAAPLSFVLLQSGPIGLRPEDHQHYYDQGAYVLRGDETSYESHPLKSLRDAENRSIVLNLVGGSADDNAPIVWAGVANKYFACLMAPAAAGSSKPPDYVRGVTLRAPLEDEAPTAGEATLDWALQPLVPLAPGQTFTAAFDIFMGPRSLRRIEAEPVLAERGFAAIAHPDRSMCTFQWIGQLMVRLFGLLHRFLPGHQNYGWAIIILVLIVRTLLHPLTKRGQVGMAKMQRGMASMQPKLEALKQKYADDRQKLQQATLELYREEGFNPATQFLSCLPMLLQMPIWVALWTTLNTTVELRHEPFFFIHDLSTPDAVYRFGSSYSIPLLSALTGPIASFNILPIIMGITMFLQQKFTQKLAQPTTPPPPSEPGKPSMADQMAMQQKMMNFMFIFFTLMFYNFPSGLCLYILTSNIFGMLEQQHIRRQIKAAEASGRSNPPSGKPRSGFGWLEKLQKKAEEARQVRAEAPRSRPVR